jgi:hypothetical protein
MGEFFFAILLRGNFIIINKTVFHYKKKNTDYAGDDDLIKSNAAMLVLY